MKNRILAQGMLFLIIFSLVSGAGAVESGAEEGTALLSVEISEPGDIERFEATGLAAYVRLHGLLMQDYLLSGADDAGRALLRQAGLSYRILDTDLRGASYYLVSSRGTMPGRRIEWGKYRRLLLDDGVQALVHTSEQGAENLAQAGVELRQVTFDPKPLRTAAPSLSLPEDITPDPLIQTMIDQIDSNTVYSYTRGLSGDWPVEIDGLPYTITTRYTNSGEPIQKATQWASEHFTDLGLDVEQHEWGAATYPNVIAELRGSVNPQDIFIIGAHLDDMPISTPAPGADDNGSGSVATLIAADVLSQYQWGCTLRFALWTGEEQGLLGSHAYALRSYQMGENILGYLNMDMISWNTPDSDPGIDLIYNPNMPATQGLAQLFDDVVSAYSLNLIPQVINSLRGGSDHQTFWDYGYTAILVIEDQNDLNPYYHSPEDTLAHQDLSYYTEFVKASLATFAHMTDCLYVEYHVDLSGDQTLTGIPGETITYTLSATHSGYAPTDTFDISLGPSTFPAIADVSEVGPLTAGVSAEFHVRVDIPESAPIGGTDTVEVTVTSQGDEGKSDSATLRTTVKVALLAQLYLPVIAYTAP